MRAGTLNHREIVAALARAAENKYPRFRDAENIKVVVDFGGRKMVAKITAVKGRSSCQ